MNDVLHAMEDLTSPTTVQADAFLTPAGLNTAFQRAADQLGGCVQHARPHQVECVTRLAAAAAADPLQPDPVNYLLQHSAGSGKSLTIAALVLALTQLVDVQQQQFHTILVVNDRLQLDRQLGNTVNALLTANGHPARAVARANSTQQLKQYLSAPIGSSSRPRVILTTVQKLSSLFRAGGVGLLRGAARRPEAAPAAAAAGGADGLEGVVIGTPAGGGAGTAAPPSAAAGGGGRGVDTTAAGRAPPILAPAAAAAAAGDNTGKTHGSSTPPAPKRQTQLTSFYSSSAANTNSSPGSAQPHKQLSQRSPAAQKPLEPGPGLTLGAAKQQAAADRLGFAAAGRVAVIADEAHRYHGSGSVDQIHALLMGVNSSSQGTKPSRQGRSGKGSGRGSPAANGASSSSSKQQRQGGTQQPKFLTYYGFTATPSARALQLFGVRQAVTLDEFGEVRDLLPDPQDPQQQQQQQQAKGMPGQQRQQQQQLGDPKQPQPAATSLPAAAAGAAGQDGSGEEAPDPHKVAHLYSPFHAYTLQQAIQDGHVLDVLQNFVSITPRLHISGAALQQQQQQTGAGGSKGSSTAAAAAAAAEGGQGPSVVEELLVEAASSCRKLVAAKAEAVVTKFLEGWQAALAGCGFQEYRGMVVVRSRQHVVWYVQEIRRLLLQQQTLLQQLLELSGEQSNAQAVAAGSTVDLVYGAFSGTVEVSAADADALAVHQQQLARCRGGLHAYYTSGIAAAASGAPGDDAGDANDADEMEIDEEGGAPPALSKRQRHQQQGGKTKTRRLPPKAASFSNRGQGTKAASPWDLALAHLEPDSEQLNQAPNAAAAARQQPSTCTTAAAAAAAAEKEEALCVTVAAAAVAGEGGGVGVGRKRQRRLQLPSDLEEEGEGFPVEAPHSGAHHVVAGSIGGSASGACHVSGAKSERSGSEQRQSGSDSDSERSWQQQSESSGGDSTASEECDKSEECAGDSSSSEAEGDDACQTSGRAPSGATSAHQEEEEQQQQVLPQSPSNPSGPSKGRLSKRARRSVSCSSSLFAAAGSDSGAAAPGSPGGSGQLAAGGEPPSAAITTTASAATPAVPKAAVQHAGVKASVKQEVQQDQQQQQQPEQMEGGRIHKLRRLVRNASRLSNSSSTTAAASAPQQPPSPAAPAAAAGAGAAAIKEQLKKQQQQQEEEEEVAQQQEEQWLITGGGAGGAAVSESDLNGRRAHHARARLLVVCSKFETGYDDPRLAALFVDRSLSGARAVQVLSRINRPAPHLGKGCPRPAPPPAAAQPQQASLAAAAAPTSAMVDHPKGSLASQQPSATHQEAHSTNTQLPLSAPGGGVTGAGATGDTKGDTKAPPATSPVLVVDFVNSIGVIREAFNTFFGTTTFCSGPAAKRLRQEQQLDAAVTRLLHLLGAAAGRLLPGGPPLAACSVGQLVGVAGRLGPEGRRALEEDLTVYCHLCTALKVEKLELPLVFATALKAALEAARERREKAAASGRFAWMQQLLQQQPPQPQPQQQQQQQGMDGPAAGGSAAGATPAAGPGVTKGAPGVTGRVTRGPVQVTVDVQDLEVSFQGAIHLNPDAEARPLRTWRLMRGGSSKGGSSSSSKAAAAAAEAAVRAGRPLLEVIAAANAQLESRYERSLAAGLQELCSRLAPGASQPPSGSSAAAVAAAAAAAGGGPANPSQHSKYTTTPAAAAAAAAGGAGGRGQAIEDVYTLLSLLRRLQLWPVSVALLKKTGAGKQVGVLQSHPNPQVAQLAKQVVAQWKAAVKAQSNTAATRSPAAAAGELASAPAAAAVVVADDRLRGKVRQLLLDAVVHHLTLVKAGSNAGVTAADGKVPGLSPQQQATAKQLAQQLEQQMFLLASGAAAPSPPPSAAADAALSSTTTGSTAAAAELKDYKTRARVLAAALRHLDGVAGDLLTGSLTAAAVAASDTRGLAPASVKQQLAEREAKQRADEEAWEALSATLVGGGGTHMSDAKCPRCGAQKAQVHNILSGGTYAQERVPIQKYVCQECTYTWRLDG